MGDKKSPMASRKSPARCHLIVLILSLVLVAAGVSPAMAVSNWKSKAGAGGTPKPPAVKKLLLRKPFGTFQNQPVTLYTLRVGRVSVDITDFGATLVGVRVPNRRGKIEDIVAGFSYSANYSSTNYGNLGCVLGRYGNRIGGHSFTIGRTRYELESNEGNNTIHSGRHTFCFKMWKATVSRAERSLSLTLSLTSPAGQGGFPGKLITVVRYTLLASGSLVLRMEAVTDKATHVNLLHHPYWNLNGAKLYTDLTATAHGHLLQIYASRYTPFGPGKIPTGEIKRVAGTPFDFRTPKPLGSSIKKFFGSVDKEPGSGYDINFVLDVPRGKPAMWPAVLLRDPASGRSLKIYTNQPGMQFYTGNWLNVVGKGGVQYTPQSFMAFETQKFPDSPNKPNFPSTLLLPGQKYQHTIIYEFSTY